MKKKLKSRKHSSPKSIIWFINLFLCLGIFLFCMFAIFFEQLILPTLLETSHIRSKTIANQMLDTSIQELLSEHDFSTADFIQSPLNSPNQIDINTQTINYFCSSLNLKLYDKLQNLEAEVFEIPLGTATDLNFFMNMGPNIPFYFYPEGIISSDYQTELISMGINQINYKIWVSISIEIQIANPFYLEELKFSKKIMLVDTIISGDVPNQYLSYSENSENLNQITNIP